MPGNEVRIRATLDDKVSGGLAKIRDNLDRIGGKGTGAVTFGLAAAKGLELVGSSAFKAGQAIGDFVGDSLKAASDLNETVAKSSVVFGAQAKQVEQWGGTLAESFGLSKQAGIEAAASFGNVFKGLGFAETESAKMSKRLVELAGDLASFNNLDPTEALEKLRAGLAGEAEPLRSVGVFLNEASVKAKAMQLGLLGANGEMTEGAKIQARYALILEQTSTAQGDFARTADGVANKQRAVNAEMENARAALGEQLLPIELELTKAQLSFAGGLNDLFDMFANKITPAALRGTEAWRGHLQAVQDANEGIERLTDAGLDYAEAQGLITHAVAADERAHRGLTQTMAGTDVAARKLAEAQAVLYGKTKSTGDITVTSYDRMGDAVRDYNDLLTKSKDTVTSYFDKIIEQDKLAATNAEIQDLRQIASKRKLTAEEKARLHELQRDQAQMLTDLAEHGSTKSKAFKDAMTDLLRRLKTAHGEERTAILAEIAALKRLAVQADIARHAVQFPGNQMFPGAAEGGYIPPGWIGAVGEKGQETLIMGSSGGYVIPNGGSSGGGGGGGSGATTIHTVVNLDGRVLAQVVDQYNAGTLGRSAATLGRT